MAYAVYIQKDYRPKIVWEPEHPLRYRIMRWAIALVLGVTSLALMGMKLVNPIFKSDTSDGVQTVAITPIPSIALPRVEPVPLYETSTMPDSEHSQQQSGVAAVELALATPPLNDAADLSPVIALPAPNDAADLSQAVAPPAPNDAADLSQAVAPPAPNDAADARQWRSVTIKPGDSLASIFSRLALSPGILHEIVNLDETDSALKYITPGQRLKFDLDNGTLNAMRYEINLTETLSITKVDDAYQATMLIDELTTHTKRAYGVIDHSLFASAKRAGLSDKLIMSLVSIYGWDIDFALNIRQGDTFTVIYQEQYKKGVKVNDGPILAAEFVNQNKAFKAARYTNPSGRSDYYSESGYAMQKAFLRTPVNFTRISSKFTLARKHPVLNTIRAHRGVDYAAPTGTPVKTVGDGKVEYVGRKGGYGKTVIIDHGDARQTVYAHLSNYAPNLKSGRWVEQGKIIGYVGSTGLATGPHLHYEFRIKGVHHNPLTLKLAHAARIPNKELPTFKQTTSPLFAELDAIAANTSVALSTEPGVAEPSPIKQGDG